MQIKEFIVISKILIIQTAFIGDVILTTPLIKATKLGIQNAAVHFLGIPSTVNVLENNPYLHRIWVYDKRGKDKGLLNVFKWGMKLRREKYDLTLIPHRSLRSALLAKLAGIPQRIGFDTSAGSFLLTQKVPYQKHCHEIERNLMLLSSVGISVGNAVPEIFPDSRDVQSIDMYFREQGISAAHYLVAMAPGSVWTTKRWPQERFARLARQLITWNSSIRILLIGGKNDRSLCQQIVDTVGRNVYNTAGQFTLRQSAYLLHRCRVLISNDSAPTHLGVAAGTRVITLFGATVPQFGFYPYGKAHRVIEKQLPCRPCSIHGGHRCPTGTFECMLKITPEEVFEVVVQLYG